MDELLSEGEIGLRKLCGSTTGDNEDNHSSGWSRHLFQLTMEYQELSAAARDWRRLALQPPSSLSSHTDFPGAPRRAGLPSLPLEELDNRDVAEAPNWRRPRPARVGVSGESNDRDIGEANDRDVEAFLSDAANAERSHADISAPDSDSAAAYRALAVSTALGRCRNALPESTPKARPVDLVMYDLSKGLAGWMRSALLSGQKWEAIWHTGVRVFGFEFWYGGDIIQAPQEIRPFGVPMRVVRLGNTERRYKEFRRFITDELTVPYSKNSYDALQCNCNHFSNDVIKYLLHGQQIPAEVRAQLDWYRNAMLVQVLRPVLTRWLGNGDVTGAISPEGRGDLDQSASRRSLLDALDPGISASFLGCCTTSQHCSCTGSQRLDEATVSPYIPTPRGAVQGRTTARSMSRERTGVEDSVAVHISSRQAL